MRAETLVLSTTQLEDLQFEREGNTIRLRAKTLAEWFGQRELGDDIRLSDNNLGPFEISRIEIDFGEWDWVRFEARHFILPDWVKSRLHESRI